MVRFYYIKFDGMNNVKRILITGANSYIGTSFEKYLKPYNEDYTVDTLDMLDVNWKEYDFSCYDTVFHVAGIAHRKETIENAHLYYEVNRNLAYEVAKKSRRSGVKQFIFLSSMSIYGMNTGVITKDTIPSPKTHYGKSKLQAENAIKKLSDDKFKVVILRPPMVYGKDCKGNYQLLRKFAVSVPFFPDYCNERSMIYIGNLCEFVKQIIDNEKQGEFCPQNADYVSTSDMVKLIADINGKDIKLVSVFNPFIKVIPIRVLDKVFGTLIYDKTDIVDKYGFEKSIELSE